MESNYVGEWLTYAFWHTSPWCLLMCYGPKGISNNHDPGSDSHHDDVIKWKHFPRYRPFVKEIHLSQRPVTQSFDVSLICTRTNGWRNYRDAGDLKRTTLSLWRHRNANQITQHTFRVTASKHVRERSATRCFYLCCRVRCCICNTMVCIHAYVNFVKTCIRWRCQTWASYQICKIADCAYAENAGNVFPATDFKGNR